MFLSHYWRKSIRPQDVEHTKETAGKTPFDTPQSAYLLIKDGWQFVRFLSSFCPDFPGSCPVSVQFLSSTAPDSFGRVNSSPFSASVCTPCQEIQFFMRPLGSSRKSRRAATWESGPGTTYPWSAATTSRIIPRFATPGAVSDFQRATQTSNRFIAFMLSPLFRSYCSCPAEENGARFLIGIAHSPHYNTRENPKTCKAFCGIGRNSLRPWRLRIANCLPFRTRRAMLSWNSDRNLPATTSCRNRVRKPPRAVAIAGLGKRPTPHSLRRCFATLQADPAASDAALSSVEGQWAVGGNRRTG